MITLYKDYDVLNEEKMIIPLISISIIVFICALLATSYYRGFYIVENTFVTWNGFFALKTFTKTTEITDRPIKIAYRSFYSMGGYEELSAKGYDIIIIDEKINHLTVWSEKKRLNAIKVAEGISKYYNIPCIELKEQKCKAQ